MKEHREQTRSKPAVLPSAAIRSLDQWLDAWKTPETPELTQRATIEWSPRLTRSLGRCYPQRHLIRIASLLESAEPTLLEEVLCHGCLHH